METISIQYAFKLNQNRREVFDLALDEENLEPCCQSASELPDWTRLPFHQCPTCPLETASHTHCPVAVSLVDVVQRFDSIISYDEIDLEVVTNERRVSQRTTAQKGISSLTGLLIATSGCPLTAYFKPMARFHLPIASTGETAYRAAGMYLLAQYFLKIDGHLGSLDLSGLKTIYDDLHVLNAQIAKRLRAAVKSDSSINAIVLLDVYAQAIPYVIDDSLEDIRGLFEPYFQSPSADGSANH